LAPTDGAGDDFIAARLSAGVRINALERAECKPAHVPRACRKDLQPPTETRDHAIRDALVEDAELACLVVRRSITDLCQSDHRGDPATLASWLANKTPENLRHWIASSHVVVAVDGIEIVGVGAITNAGEITLNYVSPAFRFRGVNKAIVNCLEAIAAQRGINSVVLRSTATARVLPRPRLRRERHTGEGLRRHP
jgi:GNAT superfamily N-acetyltransferase